MRFWFLVLLCSVTTTLIKVLRIQLPGGILVGEFHQSHKVFQEAAVATDTLICSKLGKDILKENGSAVDAAITAMLCTGLVNFHSTGIGGGGYMTIFDKQTDKVEIIDFRETIPSERKLKEKDIERFKLLTDPMLSDKGKGGDMVAVPGMLRGFEIAHKKYGKLPWKKLFYRVAELAEKGFNLTKATRKAFNVKRKRLLDSNLSEIFPYVKDPYGNFGEYKNERLAQALRILGDAGNADPFYEGEIAEDLIKIVTETNGSMTFEDLKSYKPIIRKPITVKLGDMTLFTAPPPAGGLVLASVLKIMSGFNISEESLSNIQKQSCYTHYLIEAMKWSYAKRNVLADPDYFFPSGKKTHLETENQDDISRRRFESLKELHRLLEDKRFSEIREKISPTQTFNTSHYESDGLLVNDHGTSHLSVYSADGSAVSMTTSINDYFGSFVYSLKFGYFLNNEIKDVKPRGNSSLENLILPGSRPPSLMTPSIVLNENRDVTMVTGAAGGPKIPNIVAQMFINFFWFNMDLGSASRYPRVHHQLSPNIAFAESKLLPQIWNNLLKFGHDLKNRSFAAVSVNPFGVCQIIGIRRAAPHFFQIEAVSDSRKKGEPDGY